MSDRTMTITLDPPVEHAGGKITELRLREPTGAEMRAAEKKLDGGVNLESASSFQVALMSAVTGLSEVALDELPVSVMRSAHEFVIGFDAATKRDSTDAPSLEVPLPEPLTIDGVTYAGISLVEPTVGMRRKAESALRTGATAANARHYQLILVAQASGIPFGTVEKLPVSALNDAEAYLRGFIEPGQPIGNS